MGGAPRRELPLPGPCWDPGMLRKGSKCHKPCQDLMKSSSRSQGMLCWTLILLQALYPDIQGVPGVMLWHQQPKGCWGTGIPAVT